jgi:hypothetical protein
MAVWAGITGGLERKSTLLDKKSYLLRQPNTIIPTPTSTTPVVSKLRLSIFLILCFGWIGQSWAGFTEGLAAKSTAESLDD